VFPERANPERYSMIDKFVPYLRQRWETGLQNGRKLWEKIKELGFAGGFTTVKDWLRTWRKPLSADLQSKLAKTVVKVPSTKQVSFWLLGLSKEKTEEKKLEHQNFVEKLSYISDEISKARLLGMEFIEMIRKRQGEFLDRWLQKAKTSGIADLKNFASGIELDKDAVFNAMTLEWSNGQVEGNNNRIKILKRQMYGRAKFDLLRARVLSPT
jgi:transposase